MTLASEQTVELDSFLPQEKSEKIEKNGQENHREISTDKGWAWLILAGAVLTMMIIIGCHRTGGILFIEFQEKFQSSSAETSLISTILNVTFCVVAPIVMTVGIRMTSCSVMVLVGGVLMFTSFIITTFVDDIRIVIVTHGLLQGFGRACTEAPSVSMVTKYFVKRRGVVNSIVSAGGSLGGLIIPPLITVLFEEYGYKGCLRILAAISLNICVTAAIFRHQQYHTNSKVRLCTRKSDQEKIQHRKTDSPCNGILFLFDFKLFGNPIFLLFQIAFGLLTAANFMCMFLVAPYAYESDMNSGDIATLVTVFSATDMCSRLILGIISDIGICRRSTILSICAVILSITTNLTRYYTTYGLLLVHSLIGGLTGGSVMTLHAAIIVDYLPMKHLDSTLGFAMLSMGSFCGIFLYIGGVLRDMTGSYVATLHLVGAIALLGGGIMFSLPYVEKWKKRQQG